MSIEDKTKFIIAIRNYKFLKSEKHSSCIDVTASDALNEKILLRSIEPQGKNEFVNVDDVKSMLKVMKSQDFNQGVLISRRFTVAAAEEMAQENIQQVSDEYMPPFDSEKLYLAINTCINSQCKTNCGKIPLKESDCKAHTKDGEICKIRSLSDNATFHYDQGWVDLMKNDLILLLSLNKPLKIAN